MISFYARVLTKPVINDGPRAQRSIFRVVLPYSFELCDDGDLGLVDR